MTCKHLIAIERALLDRGIKETFRGQAWSKNCREWVYFDCYIDTRAVMENFALAECVEEHVHRGTHDGSERGFYCEQCHDGLMGLFEPGPETTVFKG